MGVAQSKVTPPVMEKDYKAYLFTYFLWPEDDTGNPNYKVGYAMAKHPSGALTVPENNIVIQKEEVKGMPGTGHNSILKIPGTDDWRIFYHRISVPNGIKMPYPGIYRVVCMDELQFNADGTIKDSNPKIVNNLK